MSQDFEAFYEARAGQGPEETLDPLVLSEDGKGIVMRKEDQRQGTKRAGERDSHKLKTRLSPGEKRNRKRMATVAAVYSIERQVRTPESVMGVKSEEDVPKPRARNKRVWAPPVIRRLTGRFIRPKSRSVTTAYGWQATSSKRRRDAPKRRSKRSRTLLS